MIQLPTTKSSVQNYNPGLMIIYGRPKTGKTSICAAMDSTLILDLENGTKHVECMAVQVHTINDLFEVANAIREKCKELKTFPYKRIVIDNASRLSEMVLPWAADKYRKLPLSGGWGMIKDPTTNKMIPDPKADVTTIPRGAGYKILRDSIKEAVDLFKNLCETVILICHTKDRDIKKDGADATEVSVDLAGSLSDIMMGLSDAIGYVYRKNNETHITFDAGDNVLRGARSKHLSNKDFIVIKSEEDGELVYNSNQLFV